MRPGQSVPMTATSESTFWVEAYGTSIMFNLDDSDNITNFNYRGMTCPKMKGISNLIPEQLAEFTGNYMSDELKTVCKVAIEEGQLVLKHHRHGTFSLIHAWKDDFQLWGSSSVEFYRDKEGKVTGLVFSNNSIIKLRFVKIKVN